MNDFQTDEPRSFVPKYTFHTAVNHEEEMVALKIEAKVGGFAPVIMMEYLKCKEQAVRQGLIELGWTPPNEDHELLRNKRHLTLSVLFWLIRLFQDHPQGMIIPGDCGDLQILRGHGLITEKDQLDVVRLTSKGESIAFAMLNLLRYRA